MVDYFPRNTTSCKRTYPYAERWGGCTSIPAINAEPNKCSEIYGPGWKTYRKTDNCFLTAHRYCVKTKWPEENKLKCCTGELNSSKDCAEDWCPGTDECLAVAKDFCSANNGKELRNPFCFNICNVNNPPDWCDQVVVDYCKNHKQDNDADKLFCGCVNSEFPPTLSCFDTNCGAGSYRTKNIKNDINICNGKSVGCQENVICLSKGTCTVKDNEFRQQCGEPIPPSLRKDDGGGSGSGDGSGSGSGNGGGSGDGSGSGSGNGGGAIPTPPFWDNTKIIIATISGLVLLLVIVIIFIFVLGK